MKTIKLVEITPVTAVTDITVAETDVVEHRSTSLSGKMLTEDVDCANLPLLSLCTVLFDEGSKQAFATKCFTVLRRECGFDSV